MIERPKDLPKAWCMIQDNVYVEHRWSSGWNVFCLECGISQAESRESKGKRD